MCILALLNNYSKATKGANDEPVTFDWLEFDRLVIEMNNLHDLIGVVTLDIAEEYERGANAVSAIQSLTHRIHQDLIAKQEETSQSTERKGADDGIK